MRKIEQLEKLLRHVELVRDNGIQIGKKMMDQGEDLFARQLIANVLQHDISKFLPGEWEELVTDADADPDTLLLAQAVEKHNHANPHHPEYWGTIHQMPRLYVAEMVCDWKARSTEFGTSIMDWVDGGAMKRFGFAKDDEVYEQIIFFVNLLVDKPFEQLTIASSPANH